MKAELFKNWLYHQNFKKSTVNNRMSICNRIELNGFDLDNEFDLNHGRELLLTLSYSKKEQVNNVEPKHGIPIKGDALIGTRTLKHSANLYFLFRHYLNRQIIPKTELKEDIARIEQMRTINDEEKRVLIKYRLGQSEYRKKLVEYWNGCSVCGSDFFSVLIASHIKPWSISDEKEKYDLYNGLLLTPNYDKLFDKYLISFDDNGDILISSLLSDMNLTDLNISRKAKLNPDKLTVDHLVYLRHHRSNLVEEVQMVSPQSNKTSVTF
jgi:predicted restriction endonuclease